MFWLDLPLVFIIADYLYRNRDIYCTLSQKHAEKIERAQSIPVVKMLINLLPEFLLSEKGLIVTFACLLSRGFLIIPGASGYVKGTIAGQS